MLALHRSASRQRYRRFMATCVRPGCAQHQAGALLLHRVDRRAVLVGLDDPACERFGMALCAEHLDRSSVPEGWTLIDRRAASAPPDPAVPARPRAHGVRSSTPRGVPVWAPNRGVEVPAEMASARSPLLRRAFLGDDGGHAGLESESAGERPPSPDRDASAGAGPGRDAGVDPDRRDRSATDPGDDEEPTSGQLRFAV